MTYENIPNADAGPWRNVQISGTCNEADLWKDFADRLGVVADMVKDWTPTAAQSERDEVWRQLKMLADAFGIEVEP